MDVRPTPYEEKLSGFIRKREQLDHDHVDIVLDGVREAINQKDIRTAADRAATLATLLRFLVDRK
jgi:hypothetical protein